MHTEFLSGTSQRKLNKWLDFMSESGLSVEALPQKTVLVMEDDKILASGSRDGNILKYIAVDDAMKGENLTASIVSELKKDAFSDGINHLFLYTKPENEGYFSPLFFYKVAASDSVMLMESKKDGIKSYLGSLPEALDDQVCGAVVVNCNPFTLGHRYLIQTASDMCDRLYVFVVSEDKSLFSARDRMEMVKLGTAALENVTVIPSGPYLVSTATFPSYFTKKDKTDIKCGLDIEIFGSIIAKRLRITKRFAGSEPDCPVTAKYNRIMKERLPRYGVEFTEIPRLCLSGETVSASLVRRYIEENSFDKIKKLVPQTTFEYITKGR